MNEQLRLPLVWISHDAWEASAPAPHRFWYNLDRAQTGLWGRNPYTRRGVVTVRSPLFCEVAVVRGRS